MTIIEAAIEIIDVETGKNAGYLALCKTSLKRMLNCFQS